MTDQTDTVSKINDSIFFTFVRISTSTSTSISTFYGSNWNLSYENFQLLDPPILRLKNLPVHTAVKKHQISAQ
jgi:hypothetical protein